MFSIFGKRKSPVEVEVEEEPPIPGARSDDGFVVVDPSSPRNSLYPNVAGGGGSTPYVPRPAPPAPTRTAFVDPTFHYLQGVPFTMSKTLQMASKKDTFATEMADLLAFLTSKVNMSGYDYDFNVERSVLKEC
ncbi:hypothetical protein SFRURICE_018310 [Spodoptera frugiperda]|uniref:SFRICE_010562 n=1 Tax=Spodoptera frugiperda TaxID=7108 RepID=A0A2H1WK97_SPOFR|nr:hypothetical protein SFRURICE_018310 [Spodoptera frugiperda]